MLPTTSAASIAPPSLNSNLHQVLQGCRVYGPNDESAYDRTSPFGVFTQMWFISYDHTPPSASETMEMKELLINQPPGELQGYMERLYNLECADAQFIARCIIKEGILM